MLMNMRKLRKARGFTQEQLAKMVNASVRQIGAWERGENDLPLDYAVEIADVLKCSLDELVSDTCVSVISENQLTDEERELIALYRRMSARSKNAILQGLRAYNGSTR